MQNIVTAVSSSTIFAMCMVCFARLEDTCLISDWQALLRDDTDLSLLANGYWR